MCPPLRPRLPVPAVGRSYSGKFTAPTRRRHGKFARVQSARRSALGAVGTAGTGRKNPPQIGPFFVVIASAHHFCRLLGSTISFPPPITHSCHSPINKYPSSSPSSTHLPTFKPLFLFFTAFNFSSLSPSPHHNSSLSPSSLSPPWPSVTTILSLLHSITTFSRFPSSLSPSYA